MLSPRDQIVESIEVGHKTDSNPRNGTPDNDLVPHVIPSLSAKDRADAAGIGGQTAAPLHATRRTQLCLEFTRVDVVSLHHGFNGGIRQDLLQARFAIVRAKVARGPGAAKRWSLGVSLASRRVFGEPTHRHNAPS